MLLPANDPSLPAVATAMGAILPKSDLALPAFFMPDPAAALRFLEFFTANIRNPHTRKAYAKATAEFAAWCEHTGIEHLRECSQFM